MNDCQNVAVREALPDLVHGVLAANERAGVLSHLDGCVDCAGELAIIRSVIALSARATPVVNAAGISAAIPAYSRQAPARTGSTGRFTVAHLRLAAALVVGAVGVSALVMEHESRISAPSAVAVAHSVPAASLPTAQPGVALVGTADLTDDHLAQLIQSMAHIDAVPPAEPDPILPVAYDGDAS